MNNLLLINKGVYTMDTKPIFHYNKLYSICNKYQFFTCGSIKQYNKLFELNENKNGNITTKELALVIYICSEQSFEFIYEKLLETLEW